MVISFIWIPYIYAATFNRSKMKLLTCFVCAFFILSMSPLLSQTNYDESKVPSFEVPGPLTTFKGKKIKSVKKWEKARRPELLHFFENNVYGKIPKTLKIDSYNILEQDGNALNGKAKRKQVELTFRNNGKTLSYTILLYLPKNIAKAAVFLGYNFYGNHTITEDKAVLISSAWANNNESFQIENNTLTEESRGKRTNRWAVEKI